jgi:hypothetical protein
MFTQKRLVYSDAVKIIANFGIIFIQMFICLEPKQNVPSYFSNIYVYVPSFFSNSLLLFD